MKNKFKNFTLNDFVKYLEKMENSAEMLNDELLPELIKRYRESDKDNKDTLIKFLQRQIDKKDIKGYIE